MPIKIKTKKKKKKQKTVTRILEILKNNENKEEKEENQSINLERKLSALKYGLSAVNDIIRLYIRGIQYDPDDSTPFELLPLPLQSVLQPTDFYISILKTSNQKVISYFFNFLIFFLI